MLGDIEASLQGRWFTGDQDNTDPVGNSTSAGQEGQLELGDITLVDGSNINQDDANNAEELTKPNKS